MGSKYEPPAAPAKVMIAIPARLRADIRALQARLKAERGRAVTVAEAIEYLLAAEQAGRKASEQETRTVTTESEKAITLSARDAVLSIPCPECKRPALSRCITLDTHQPTNLVHKARVIAWQKAAKS